MAEAAAGEGMSGAVSLESWFRFGQGSHRVRLSLAPARLGVEVEAAGTGERWRGEFDASSIEALTRRTGNFKQFPIFCSMLESALRKSSGSVTLELLTYGDLESLRSLKRGGGGAPPQGNPPRNCPLAAKRYLLLVYCVEFDRIHYPLPLPPATPSPPPALRDLRAELDRYRRENQNLREELERFRGAVPNPTRVESELRRERVRYQREKKRWAAELAEAKASEQRLQQKIQSLRAEVAACRRGQRHRSNSRGGSGDRPSPTAPPHFDPPNFNRTRQHPRELKKGRGGGAAAFGSSRTRGRSSSAESLRGRRSGLSSGSDTEGSNPPRGRTRTRRPLSDSSCNSPSTAPRPPSGRNPLLVKHLGKENDLEEIDARLRALQNFMAQLGTPL